MNNSKRTFNPLLGQSFRYSQAEDLSLKYQGNWGVVAQDQEISGSVWEVENGDAVLSSPAFAVTGLTSVLISGSTGENTIVNTVTFADGQIDSRIIKLKITDNDVPNINYDYGIGGEC